MDEKVRQNCDNCVYFKLDTNTFPLDQGNCRRHSPVLEDGCTTWPLANRWSWCGDWGRDWDMFPGPDGIPWPPTKKED